MPVLYGHLAMSRWGNDPMPSLRGSLMRTTLPLIRWVVERPAQICVPVIIWCKRMISRRQPPRVFGIFATLEQGLMDHS
jgi:hypothetical protein